MKHIVNEFEYFNPQTLEEALKLLSQYEEGDFKVIAGGQSLNLLLKHGMLTPEYLIDIKGISDLDYIKFDEKQGLKKFILLIKRTAHPINNQIAKKIISREGEAQMKDIGFNIVSSIYTNGAYDWIIIFTCRDLKEAKKASELFRKKYPKHIEKILLLEALFQLKVQNILNPNIENLKETFS